MSDIESRLSAIEERLDRLERLAAYVPRSVEPPQVRHGDAPPPPPPPPPISAIPMHWQEAAPPPSSPRMSYSSRTAEETEYQIGAKVLPIVGAVATLGAIATIVSLGLQRGWITPAMLFAGVCIASLSLVGVGLWKRNEREGFGQILTGIGSCGLYMNFAAGHVYQKLYEGNVLVGLFIALSLLNLSFAAWRASKPFLAIGLLGGLTAALMPLHEHNLRLDVVLQFLILVPVTMIVARNRWSGTAMAVYGVGIAALLPALTEATGAQTYDVAVGLIGTAILAVTAYALADKDGSTGTSIWFCPAALVAANVLALSMWGDRTMGSIVLVGAAATASVAWTLRTCSARNAIFIGAVLGAFINAPYGLTLEQSAWTYVALGLLFVAVSMRTLRQAAAGMAGLELLAATWAYLELTVHAYPPGAEALLLAGLMILAVASAYALQKVHGECERFALAALLFVGPVLLRLSYRAAFLPVAFRETADCLVGGLLVYAAILCAVAVTTRWRSALSLGWIAIGFGAFAHGISLFTDSAQPGWVLVAIEVWLGWLAILFLLATKPHTAGQSRTTLGAIATFMVAGLATRFGTLALQSMPMSGPIAALSAASAAAVIASVIARYTNYRGAAWGATVWLVFAGSSFWIGLLGDVPLVHSGWPIEVGLLVSIILCCSALQRIRETNETYWVGVVGAWPIVSLLGWQAFGPKGLGMNDNAALTASWIVLALSLLTTGFLRGKMHLRLSSMVVLAATIVKVVLVDLANTDQAIKALILVLLGLLSLGGGYWYIRSRGAALGADR